MNIEKEKAKKFNDKLNKIWKNQVCPICGSKDFVTLDRVFELREFKEGNQIYPVLPVICSKCGYTIFFNYLLIEELLKKEEKNE